PGRPPELAPKVCYEGLRRLPKNATTPSKEAVFGERPPRRRFERENASRRKVLRNKRRVIAPHTWRLQRHATLAIVPASRAASLPSLQCRDRDSPSHRQCPPWDASCGVR